jgi:high affinity choline transporter 7
MAFIVPPLLMGVAALNYQWPEETLGRLRVHPSETLPMLFAEAVPPVIGILGLAAIVGAVTSSFSSSILSAGSMLSWNGLKRLAWPSLSLGQMRHVIRSSILLFGAIATVLALKVQSVQALWFFTSDLVFVLLFPQLVFALFDRRANRIGSITAFAASLVLRAGGGEPLLGLPHFIPYPEIFAGLLTGSPADWYDPQTGAMLFPFKTFAAVAGLLLLPIVSRVTMRWDRPRALHSPVERERLEAPGGIARPEIGFPFRASPRRHEGATPDPAC